MASPPAIRTSNRSRARATAAASTLVLPSPAGATTNTVPPRSANAASSTRCMAPTAASRSCRRTFTGPFSPGLGSHRQPRETPLSPRPGGHGHRVLTPALPGRGAFDEDRSWIGHGDNVAAVLAAIDADSDGPVVLAGHSPGRGG